jgi:succinoglycan biosynthesis protein ExoA
MNEAAHVEQAIRSLLADPAADACSFLLMDGGSIDGTLDIVRAAFGDRVEIINNPERLQTHAVNLAAQIAADRGARFLLRADLHALYPKRFLSLLLDTAGQHGAQSVVVPMKTMGGNAVQNAAALVFGSWLGNGGSPHRTSAVGGWVEHGHHALFDLDAYLTIGGYDPEFAANEDAEFDARLRARGGRIYLENRAALFYVPRSSLAGTFRQFLRNGRFRIWTAVKHSQALEKRQLLPLALLPVLALLLLLSPWLPGLLLLPVTYVVLLLFLAWKARDIAPVPVSLGFLVLAAQIAAASHLGFSAGGLWGLFELYIKRPLHRKALVTRTHSDLRA